MNTSVPRRKSRSRSASAATSRRPAAEDNASGERTQEPGAAQDTKAGGDAKAASKSHASRRPARRPDGKPPTEDRRSTVGAAANPKALLLGLAAVIGMVAWAAWWTVGRDRGVESVATEFAAIPDGYDVDRAMGYLTKICDFG
ncbi:MAG: hypothetical protein AAF958_03440, partial [Planctomycetota bacterium]